MVCSTHLVSCDLPIQLTACLATLDRLSVVEACEAVETLLVYIENIVKAPLDPKFRAIRVSNQNYHERLGHLNSYAWSWCCMHANNRFSCYDPISIVSVRALVDVGTCK